MNVALRLCGIIQPRFAGSVGRCDRRRVFQAGDRGLQLPAGLELCLFRSVEPSATHGLFNLVAAYAEAWQSSLRRKHQPESHVRENRTHGSEG